MPPRRKADAPAPNGDAGQAAPKKRPRAKRAPRASPVASIPTIDQELQQRERQPRQEQPQQLQQSAETTRLKVEGDASSEASTLVLGGSPSPTRLTSPDVERTAVASVIGSDTAGGTEATLPKAKRQRARKDGLRGKRCATAVTSGSGGQSPKTAAASAAAVVHHEVVPQKTGRAKRTVSRCRHEFPRDIFMTRAVEGRAALPQDLANRRFQYPFPLIGHICCDFIGKTIDKNCKEISAEDSVIFRWSYVCTPRPDIQIKGSSDSIHLARKMAVGELPPRTTRVMLDAIVLAKVYEKLSPELCPFVKKYCSRNELGAGECEVLSIGFPKQLAQMPPIEDFVDPTGASAKWIRCSCIGDTDKSICHPGASARYSTNRLTHSVSELRVFNIKDKKEARPESFKLRKRSAIRKDKLFPASLDDVNSGTHRGVRDVIAYGTALAEFELAKHEKRNVSVAKAMEGFDLDPFAWEDSAGSNMVVVLWKSADGRHHLQTGNLRYLLGLTAKTGAGQDVEPTDSIIEVI